MTLVLVEIDGALTLSSCAVSISDGQTLKEPLQCTVRSAQYTHTATLYSL